MKRIFALVLSFVFLLSCLVLPAGAMFDPSPVYQVQAASAYIVNTDTNIIVYDKDSTKQVSAGGLTKYMTIALLLTNYADHLDDTFQMPFAISDYVYNTNNADMRSNETFTYREAMYAMLTRNANEAAMGLAYALSGGQQQRLCIARAMAVSPSVLLMDEPASALDPISTAKVEELIHELKKQYTIVIVTHNMQQAARVSDSTAFFYMGEMVEFGDTKKIFTNPDKVETQNYITGRFG